MSIDNQNEYWDAVAAQKTFTHPIDIKQLSSCLTKDSVIVDYGCGYGRIVRQLLRFGFQNTIGFDTSNQLIQRGKTEHQLPIHHIENPQNLPIENNTADCILLFAVLTCIPSNTGQTDLLNILYTKLKKGGILYISDYYLQKLSAEVSKYEYLNGDEDNFGVFYLAEGVTFRHHTKEWITGVTQRYHVQSEKLIEVKTMNGNTAEAFQLLLKK